MNIHNRGKNILFLAGGRWQVPWIKTLKEKNNNIVLVDPNDVPPCAKWAEDHWKIDVKNVNEIILQAKKNNFNFDYITSEQTDVATIPVATLSEYFGLSKKTLEVVERFTRKDLSREFVKYHFGKGHIPKYKFIHNENELIEFQNLLDNQIIVKPVDSQSSRGIFTYNGRLDKSQLSQKFYYALDFSQQSYLIAEEFINGTEITIEGICLDGTHHILAASQKKHFRTGIASELIYPLSIKQKVWQQIKEFHNAVIEKTGFVNGLTHSEYIIDEHREEFKLVEMACRGGGTLIPSDIIPWVSGVPVYEILYNKIFDNTDEYSLELNSKPKHALLHFFEFPEGNVSSINGLNVAKNIPGVHMLDIEFKPGDFINPASDDRNRQGFMIILATSNDEIEQIKQEVYKTIHIEYQN